MRAPTEAGDDDHPASRADPIHPSLHTSAVPWAPVAGMVVGELVGHATLKRNRRCIHDSLVAVTASPVSHGDLSSGLHRPAADRHAHRRWSH